MSDRIDLHRRRLLTNVQTAAEKGAEQWRPKKVMADGDSLPDIGLYCLSAARFLTREEPVESARSYSASFCRFCFPTLAAATGFAGGSTKSKLSPPLILSFFLRAPDVIQNLEALQKAIYCRDIATLGISPNCIQQILSLQGVAEF